MQFAINARIECNSCEKSGSYDDYYPAEDFEDFASEEFENDAIDHFKNEGWTRGVRHDFWLCPDCNN